MNRLRRTMVVMLTVVTGCASLPRPGRPSMPDVQFRMRDFRLANGMRIIVEEDHASPLVGVFTVVGVGGAGDPEGRAGLAHLIEHLAFRTKPGGKTMVWNQLEAAGVGFLNAMTQFDLTTYMEVGSKDLLPKLLAIDAARLLNPMLGVDEKTFLVEREVVRNELRQRGENALGPAFNFLQEAAFPPSHHYSRPIGGSHESLSAITFEDAKKFAAEFYKPSNLTMLIIGDVDLATIDKTLMRALPISVWQPLPPTSAPYPARVVTAAAEPPAPPAEKLIRRNSTVASPELYVVWSLPRSFDAETVLLDFVERAASRELGQAFNSDPDIVNVQVFSVPGLEASMLVAQATLRKGDHVEKSYERVLDQLVKLWASGDSGREYSGDESRALVEKDKAFSRARNAALMGMTIEAENIMSRGVERAQSAHFTGDPLTYSRRLTSLATVNDGKVSHYAEKYLQRSRARAVLVEPFPANAKGAGNGPTGLSPAAADPLTAPLPPEAVKQLGRAHAEKAKLETIVTAKREQIVETLPNGLKVLVQKRRNALPVVVTRLTFETGAAGTTPKGAAELAQQLASPRGHRYGYGGDYGIAWRSGVQTDRSSVIGSGASGNVANMLAQLREMTEAMRVENSELQFFKSEFADYLGRTEDLPAVKADRELEAALFGGHPFGETTRIADQVKLSATELEQWFDRARSPDRAVLVVTGDLDAEATFAEVKKWFADWKPVQNPFPRVAPLTLPTRPTQVLVTHQPNATQAQVHLACLAEGKTQLRDFANQTTASLLGSALFDKIREELGASYGFGGGARPLIGGMQRLDWNGSIENSRLNEAMAVLSGAVKNFETQTLTGQGLDRARWQVARDLTMSNATAMSLSAELTEQALTGREAGSLNAAFDQLAGVGKDQVVEAWKQCAGSLVVSIIGDEATVREALKKATF